MSIGDRKLKLEVLWKGIDKLTGPMKRILETNKTVAKGMNDTRASLKALEKSQKQVGKFRELQAGLRKTSVDMKAAQEKVNSLAKAMKDVDEPTKKMSRDFEAAIKVSKNLKSTYQQQSETLQQMRDKFAAAGQSTHRLVEYEKSLRNDVTATTAALEKQKKKLESLARIKQRSQTLKNASHSVAGAGMQASIAGAAMSVPLYLGIHKASEMATQHQRIRALGLGEQSSQESIKFAEQMKTVGTTQVENVELMRDALSVLTDPHHAQAVMPLLAKMKFANRTLYGDAKSEDSERKFLDMLKVIELRKGTMSTEEFKNQADMIQRVISATGGRVGPEEWRNLVGTGGLAAKGIGSESFYYQLEPLVQEMGGNRLGTAVQSAYANLYQGTISKRAARRLDQLGLIGDRSKVDFDKAGQLTHLNIGALKGSDLFQKNQFEWMEKVLLPQLAAKGITKEKDVLDAMGGIFSNRTASSYFATMYQQRAQIHKNAKLNAGAADVDQLDKLAKASPAGKLAANQAKLEDVQLRLGDKVMPLYISALEKLNSVLETTLNFMDKHPTLTKWLIVGFTVLAAALLILGPILLGISAIMSGLSLVMSPVTLVILAVVAAVAALAFMAYELYDHWGDIKEFFKSLWDGIKDVFRVAWDWICDFVGTGVAKLEDKLPDWVKQMFGMQSSGSVNIAHNVTRTLATASSGTTAQLVNKTTPVVDTKNPPPVPRLPNGLGRNVVRNIAAAGAGMTIASTPALANLNFDTRPPVTPASTHAASSVNHVQIHVHPSPGMNESDLARMVAAELEKHERKKGAQARSRLSDDE